MERELSETATECLLISDWIEEYLGDVQDRFSVKTYKEKRSVFIRFSKEEGITPDLPVESLSKSICHGFLRKQFKNRSGYAANKDRKNLASAWNWGRDNFEKWPKGENPLLAIPRFPEVRSERYVPPVEDFCKVYNLAEGQDRIMLLAFLHLAARRGEVFGLKWSDVDFSNNQVRLWTRKRTGGHKEADWLPMTSELRGALLEWWEKRPFPSPYVFICVDKTQWALPHYGRPFTSRIHLMRKLCRKAGVKYFSYHAIRHLTATILYHKGYSPSHIQAVLRHKNPNTTARYLRSLGLEHVREALEEGLKGPALLIPFRKKALEVGSLKG